MALALAGVRRATASALVLCLTAAACTSPGGAPIGAVCPTTVTSRAPAAGGTNDAASSTVWQLTDLSADVGSGAPLRQHRPSRRTPRPVPALTDVIDIASTASTYFAVRSDGTVWVWGLDVLGFFGRTTARGYSDNPVRVPGVTDARWIRIVGATVFVGRADGSVVGWGDGSLLLRPGKSSTGMRGMPRPSRINIADLRSVDGGELTAVAVVGDGTVVTWGWPIPSSRPPTNRSGQPSSVSGLSAVVAVAAGLGAAYALRDDGTVCAWGSDVHGELGQGTRGPEATDPVLIAGLPPMVQVAAGDRNGFALSRTGAVWAWGDNIGDDADRADVPQVGLAPRIVGGLPRIASISATGSSFYAVSAEGRLYGWGSTFGVPISSRVAPGGVGGPTRIAVEGRVRKVAGRLALVNSTPAPA